MNIFYIPFILYYRQHVLLTLKVSSLLSSLNDASVDIIDEGSFQFSPEAEVTSPLYVHITLQQTLKQNQCLLQGKV